MVEAEILYELSDAGRQDKTVSVELVKLSDRRPQAYPEPPPLPGQLATLQVEVASLTRAHGERVERLHDRLEHRLRELEQLRSQAIKATVVADQALETAERQRREREAVAAERDALRAELERIHAAQATEHQRRVTAERYASMMSVLPWYAWRRRQRLRASLDVMTLDD